MDDYTKDVLRFVGYLAIGVIFACILLGITALVIGAWGNG